MDLWPDGQDGERERRAVRLGVAGVILAFLALASLHAATVRPFLPPTRCPTPLFYALVAAPLRLGEAVAWPLVACSPPCWPRPAWRQSPPCCWR